MTWFRNELPLKLASLVLALFVWMYLKTEARTVQVFQVPLELADLPADYALVGDLPDAVSVRIRASDSTTQTLSPGRFQARTSLAGAQPGEFTLRLTADIVRAPFGVEVLRVDPSELKLQVELPITR